LLYQQGEQNFPKNSSTKEIFDQAVDLLITIFKPGKKLRAIKEGVQISRGRRKVENTKKNSPQKGAKDAKKEFYYHENTEI